MSRKGPGASPRRYAEHRRALAQIGEDGPIPAAHGVVRWRLLDLAQWVWDEFSISISPQTLSRELRRLGYRKLSARPRHHAQDADAIPILKKLPGQAGGDPQGAPTRHADRSEEHTYELQSLMRISYAVFCSKQKQQ